MFANLVRLFTAVAGVTAGFTWTVGQSGLKQTNSNLCELYNSLHFPAYPSCEFQYVLPILWLLVFGAFVVWACVELLRLVRRLTARRNRVLAYSVLTAFFLIGSAVSIAFLYAEYRKPGDVASSTAIAPEANQPPSTEASASSSQAPAHVSDPNSIYQAGIAVGRVFGARRSPQDATLFTFVEITQANQFNPLVEFNYLDQILKLKGQERRIGFDISRPNDGMIYGNVTARIVPKIPTTEMKAQKVQAARRWLTLANEMAAMPRFTPLSKLPLDSDKWMQLPQDEKDRLWKSAMNQESQKNGDEQRLFEQRFAQRLEQARTEMVQYGVDTEYVFETPATNDLKTRLALRMRSPELPIRIGAAARKLLASEGENAKQ